ncbi:MAG TPA: hypothetical protein VJG31_01515 [Candidatus Nanoarchaeia archaeon]|nr:hypothetical protein [Candidatus Nanoarchaeia archaeon]
MAMLTFKVTEGKIKEILGKKIDYYTTFWKSETIFPLIFLAGMCIFAFLIVLPVLFLYPASEPFDAGKYLKGGGISFLVIISLMTGVMHSATVKGRPEKIAARIHRLVNDPELFWLNFHKEKNMAQIKGEIRWKRTSQVLTPENFLTMAYLQQNEGSQGIHRKILRWRNSNSARVNLKRLARRGFISEEGGDFCYLPWEFLLIDSENRFLGTSAAKKMEKLLDLSWEVMLRRVLKEEEKDDEPSLFEENGKKDKEMIK